MRKIVSREKVEAKAGFCDGYPGAFEAVACPFCGAVNEGLWNGLSIDSLEPCPHFEYWLHGRPGHPTEALFLGVREVNDRAH